MTAEALMEKATERPLDGEVVLASMARRLKVLTDCEFDPTCGKPERTDEPSEKELKKEQRRVDSARAVQKAWCAEDVVHFFNYYLVTYDPRLVTQGLPAYIPFDLFRRQEEMLRWLDARVVAAEEGLLEKSRDIGWTWTAAGYALQKWLFIPGFRTTFGSRKVDLVDKLGDPDSILEKVRLMIDNLPPWMRPKGWRRELHALHCKITNPENGNLIGGEGGQEMGRGGRASMYVIDEGAYIDHADSVAAAILANAECRIWASSVNGPGDLFAKKRHDGTLRPDQIFTFHFAQPLDTKILTPNGWRLMGEIQLDDHVIGLDGAAKKVLGVYPQGFKEVYKVQFSDGASTECCADHLWDIIPLGNQRSERKHITCVLPLKEMIDDFIAYDGRGFRRHKYQIPIVTSAVEFLANGALPLDPYVLGCFLGDGSFPKNSVRPIVLSCPDKDLELVATVNARLPEGCELKRCGDIQHRVSSSIKGGELGRGNHNPMNRIIRELKLVGTESHNKFVPQIYLFSSVKDRLELLQGLMDTDGCASGGEANYSTTSKQLADDVVFITQTLGGVARIYEFEPKLGCGFRPVDGSPKLPITCRKSYSVRLTLSADITPFKLSRKADEYRPVSKYKPRRSIIQIEAIGVKECKCIEVEGGRYLTEHCIVTHNSDDPRKDKEWEKRKRRELASTPWMFAQEFDIDYTAAVEGICIPAKWVQAALRLGPLLNLERTGIGVAGLDIGDGCARSVLQPRFGPLLTPPYAWLLPDTTNTAFEAIDACKAEGLTVINYDTPGVGKGVSSTLKLNPRDGLAIHPINTGSPATWQTLWDDGQNSRQKCANLKAELWWLARERFRCAAEHYVFLTGDEILGIESKEHEVDELFVFEPAEGHVYRQLIVELSTPTRQFRTDGRIRIESKEDLQKRGVASPDYADACVLTLVPDGSGEAKVAADPIIATRQRGYEELQGGAVSGRRFDETDRRPVAGGYKPAVPTATGRFNNDFARDW